MPPESEAPVVDERLLSLVGDASFWRAAAPGLAIEGDTAASPCAVTAAQLERASAQIRTDGYLKIDDLLPATAVEPVREGVARLVEHGWPPVFVFVYDAPWRVLASLRPVLEALLGPGYRGLAELWAWSIAASDASAGWPPHRDRDASRVRADGTPDVLTLWIAITDATPENGCMYVLPASRDAAYRDADVVLDVRRPADVRALPARAGSVLGWTQQLLHWGGRSSRWAAAPRVSISMSFQRGDIAPVGAFVEPDVPPFDARVRLIGAQIRRYAHVEAPSAGLARLAEAMASAQSVSTSGQAPASARG
jgi:hypothetical protein